jgi:putative tryptophan/tyrosine transport system substrate-binding protein
MLPPVLGADMRRRNFIAGIGSAAAVWPVVARAQQPAMPVVGMLGIFPLEQVSSVPRTGLRKGLGELGFIENQNVLVETRWTEGAHYDRLTVFASELVRRPVDVLVATGSAGVAKTAKAATTRIPIVFANGSDPVTVGLVNSLNRPGGNATGVTFLASEIGPKRLELLRELVPNVAKVAFLVNPTNPVTEGDIKEIEKAAITVSQRIVVVRAATESDLETAFETIEREHADALLVNVDAFFNGRRDLLAALAARYRIPAIYNTSQYAKAGGLFSYGDDRLDMYRHVGRYVGRILKGETPDNLPVLQPTKFDLVINLKTAKALGLTVPPSLIARADEVIE